MGFIIFILVILILVTIGNIKTVKMYKEKKRIDGTYEGKHLVDFKAAYYLKGYIAENHLVLKHGWDFGIWLIPVMFDIDLKNVVRVGFMDLRLRASSNVPIRIVFYDRDNNVVHAGVSVSSLKHARALFTVLKEHVPYIQIEM